MSFVATEVPVASSGPSSFFALLWSRFSLNLSVSFPELTYPRGEGALFCRLSLTLDPEKLLDFSLKTRPALASSTPHGKRNAARHPDEPWCQSRGEDEVVEGSRVSKEGRSGRRDSVGGGESKCVRDQTCSGNCPQAFLPRAARKLHDPLACSVLSHPEGSWT